MDKNFGKLAAIFRGLFKGISGWSGNFFYAGLSRKYEQNGE
jgi:hypothetical protein